VAGLNKVILIGNLGRDPEMRYLPSGSPVTNFSLAVTRRARPRDGQEAREETEWFRVSAFDRLAEIANEYLVKGRQVYVEGRVRLHTWQDQNGEQRAGLDVVATDIVLLGQRGDQGEGGGGRPANNFSENNDFDNMPF